MLGTFQQPNITTAMNLAVLHYRQTIFSIICMLSPWYNSGWFRFVGKTSQAKKVDQFFVNYSRNPKHRSMDIYT